MQSLQDLNTVFVVCGYGQSRSIPYYIYLSPKVKANRLDTVADYLPTYETLMSKDTPEQQVEKLVLADLIHGNQLNEGSQHFNGVHPWSLSLIRDRLAGLKVPPETRNMRLYKPELYQKSLQQETDRLANIYQNLVRDRYLDVSKAEKAGAVDQLKDHVSAMIRDEPHRLSELP